MGQAGVQLGATSWELYCLEHGISPDGQLKDDSSKALEEHELDTFFSHPTVGKYVPRAIMVDLEPSVVEQFQASSYRNLFHPDQLICGKEDAANNYARGYYTVGRKLIENLSEKLRLAAENCNGLVGFLVFHSVGGGKRKFGFLMDSNSFSRVLKKYFPCHLQDTTLEIIQTMIPAGRKKISSQKCTFFGTNYKPG